LIGSIWFKPKARRKVAAPNKRTLGVFGQPNLFKPLCDPLHLGSLQ